MPIKLLRMTLVWERKLEYPQKAPNGRTYKLRAHRAEAGFKPPTTEVIVNVKCANH